MGDETTRAVGDSRPRAVSSGVGSAVLARAPRAHLGERFPTSSESARARGSPLRPPATRGRPVGGAMTLRTRAETHRRKWPPAPAKRGPLHGGGNRGGKGECRI